jgi:hypothetical protein
MNTGEEAGFLRFWWIASDPRSKRNGHVPPSSWASVSLHSFGASVARVTHAADNALPRHLSVLH